MNDAGENEGLYQDAIVALARSAHGAGKLEPPGRRAVVDNPLCGDRVTVELTVQSGKVGALRHTVKGCLLCQAAASLLGLRAPGASPKAVAANAAALSRMLKDGKKPPEDAWPELAIFQPVSRHKSRFECVLLPFQAAQACLERT